MDRQTTSGNRRKRMPIMPAIRIIGRYATYRQGQIIRPTAILRDYILSLRDRQGNPVAERVDDAAPAKKAKGRKRK